MKRAWPVLALCAAGCQTLGPMATPHTLPQGDWRLSAAPAYHDYQVTDEYVRALDLQLQGAYGITDDTELDVLLDSGGGDVRFKHALLSPGRFSLAVTAGLGFFTSFNTGTSALYLPVDLVGGLSLAPDVTVFLGPRAQGGIAATSEGQAVGLGFNDSLLGAWAGGVAGLAFEGSRLTVVPQISAVRPVVAGAGGWAVELSVGFGGTFHTARSKGG